LRHFESDDVIHIRYDGCGGNSGLVGVGVMMVMMP
jgi:hypothetical protein